MDPHAPVLAPAARRPARRAPIATTAAEREASPKVQALLRALGFDPATHDCMPVVSPWRGVQVLKDGVRVRFFTERQVRKHAGAWKTALRTGVVAS